MGRRRALATTSALPRYVYKRRASYYFRPPIGVRRWIPLGPDLSAALVRYVQLVCDAPETQQAPAKLPMTFGELAEVYVIRELPRKAPASQRGNWVDLSNLRPVFDAVALDDITPVDIRAYLDLRGQVTEVRANREIALFSHMWNRAREWGFTQLANPCVGVRKFKEEGRDIYVSDADLKAVWNAATLRFWNFLCHFAKLQIRAERATHLIDCKPFLRMHPDRLWAALLFFDQPIRNGVRDFSGRDAVGN